MPGLKNCLLFAAIVGLAPLAIAAGDPVEERHERMEEVGNAAGPLGGMLKGELEFDAAVALASFVTMKEQIDGIGQLFPEGSYVGGEDRAAEAVWTNRADFDQKMADFAVALDNAIAASPQDLESLQPVAQNVFRNCKACHEDYRIPGQ
jgi:cytochrome c556